MGKMDVMTKAYMSDNHRFADIFNYFLYGGKEVLRAEDLEEKDPVELFSWVEHETFDRAGNHGVVTGSDRNDSGAAGSKIFYTKKERDLLRSAVVKVSDEVYYVLLGLENQSFVDYGMPVRKMIYEAMRYDHQRREKAQVYEKMRKEGKKVQMTSSEFLSGFCKRDKLIPVITLTIYFGQEDWDGPLSLHEMFDVKDKNLLSYIEDYKVNLILPKKIEDFDNFRTEIRQLLETIKAAGNKQEMKKLMEENESFKSIGKDTAMMIKVCTGANIVIDEMEDKVNMCKAFEDLRKEYMEEGFSAGRNEGFSVGRNEGFSAGKDAAFTEMVRKLLKKGMKPEDIAEITELSVREVQNIIDKGL